MATGIDGAHADCPQGTAAGAQQVAVADVVTAATLGMHWVSSAMISEAFHMLVFCLK